jgi:hypothetical protein
MRKDRRPRPYNKYLAWELGRFPLPGWESAALLDVWGGDLSLPRSSVSARKCRPWRWCLPE